MVSSSPDRLKNRCFEGRLSSLRVLGIVILLTFSNGGVVVEVVEVSLIWMANEELLRGMEKGGPVFSRCD